MQAKTPQSLRGGSLDGVVDMIVVTPEELVSKLETNKAGEISLPLLGADAKRAYESLMNVVITPLCRSEKIMKLLYDEASSNDTDLNDGNSRKPIRVGALLSGAAGVGKTSLAYHCASVAAQTSRVTLLDVSCTSLIHKEIGGSERAVHRLFEAVRAAAPCILLLDGVENVAPRRGNDCTTEGTMDRVLSTFLTEMDGINDGVSASGNVGVIGITYNPELIDPSLLRPGRLEKTIQLGSPGFEARKELVARDIDGLKFDFASAGYFDPKNKNDISHYVAMQTAGMSAVETIAICKEASMECLRELNFSVSGSVEPSLRYHHFQAAVNIMKGKILIDDTQKRKE
jgi:SpoVK/Ycf46/Vps4 family AAA+-type ATPase